MSLHGEIYECPDCGNKDQEMFSEEWKYYEEVKEELLEKVECANCGYGGVQEEFISFEDEEGIDIETEGEKLIRETEVLLKKISKDIDTKGDISAKDTCILAQNMRSMQIVSINAKTIEERNQFHKILDDISEVCDRYINLDKTD